MKKKRIIKILAVILLLILIFLLFPRKGNLAEAVSLWEEAMASQAGSFRINTTFGEDEMFPEISSAADIEYEIRENGFWYRRTQYSVEEGGKLKQTQVVEESEGGKRIKVDNMEEIENPGWSGKDTTLQMMLELFWPKPSKRNVQEIEKRETGPYIEYTIRYKTQPYEMQSEEEAGQMLVAYPDRETVIWVETETHMVRKLLSKWTGFQNDTERTPVYQNTEIEFFERDAEN